MRPARKGPENTSSRRGATPTIGFNEAGPQGAGKRYTPSQSDGIRSGFNEAGPQGAGKRGRRLLRDGGRGASMRPARKGPENGAPEAAVLVLEIALQ